MTKRNYEYIVLGLGGFGSGAAYWLSRRAGADVLGLEQFELGHVRGGSHDHSRIIRLSYNTPEYVRLARHAYAAWGVLEAEAGESLIQKTGGLDLFPPHQASRVEAYVSSMQAAGVPFEQLNPAEVKRRWPQFRLSDEVQSLYQADAGIAAAARCTAAHQRLAREHGATLLERTPITRVRPANGEMEVVAGSTTYRCRKLIITAGAWANRVLAQLGRQLPLTVTQEQFTYFATPHLADFAPDRFPIWIWQSQPDFYGFPVYGEAAVKAAQHIGGREVTADSRSFDPDPVALQRLQDFLQEVLPTALGPILYTKTCLYTLTPDQDFIISTILEQENCMLAIGAGHGFKFASLIGQILSELAIDGATDKNITPFSANRPVLTEKDPPKTFTLY